MRSLEQSLLRLGTGHIDIALIHDVDVWTHGRDAIEGRISEALTGAYPALHDLRAQGVVKAIGIGVNEADICARFARETDMDIVLLAAAIRCLKQRARCIFPAGRAKNIDVLLGGVFNSGILATRRHGRCALQLQARTARHPRRVTRLEQVCSNPRRAAAGGGIAFRCCPSRGEKRGARSRYAQEVADNIAAMTTPVPPALWQALKTEGCWP